MHKCKLCNKNFSRKDGLLRHIKEVCYERSQPSTSDDNSTVAPAAKKMKFCDECNLDIPIRKFPGHLKTYSHKMNVCRPDNVEGVELIQSAFKQRIASYKIRGDNEKNVDEFFQKNRRKIIKLLTTCLEQFPSVKIYFELFAEYVLLVKELLDIKSFNTKNVIVTSASNLDAVLDDFVAIIKMKMSEFNQKESGRYANKKRLTVTFVFVGWIFKDILHLEVNINNYNPLRSSSYIPLPFDIANKKAVLNIQNNDVYCFKWCILAFLHPKTSHPERVKHYIEYEEELNFAGIEFPVKLSEISKFETQNSISVNVYGTEKFFDCVAKTWKSQIIGPFYLTSSKQKKHVDLLLIFDDVLKINHFCLIINMSRLVRCQISSNHNSQFLCSGCLVFFSNREKLQQHMTSDCNKIVTQLPTTDLVKDKFGNEVPQNVVKFKNFDKCLKLPFVIYMDFESLLQPLDNCEPSINDSFTIRTHLHKPYTFGYYIKCSYDNSLSILRSNYFGTEAASEFVKQLELDVQLIYQNHLKNFVPMQISCEEELNFQSATRCHLCNKIFAESCTIDNIKVRNHCHVTGKFLGAAHTICNLNYKLPSFIPIFCHNLSGYDSHLFIKELATKHSNMSVIAQNKERYISFSKKILVDKVEKLNKFGEKVSKLVYMELRFLDSYRFMASPIEKLANNLLSEDCNNVRKYFDNDEKFFLIRQKGVFPYSYLDRYEKLNDTVLPNQSQFYDVLRKDSITQEDYERACKVWNVFECKTLKDYTKIYLESDVLLLADIFENFRNICLKIYSLDPAHYFTAPSLSWDAMLKFTGVELELLTDIDQLHFIKKGIRGGMCQCVRRKSIANNQFLPNFDSTKNQTYIIDLDATNLYGKSMGKFLPYGHFEWENPENFNYDTIMQMLDNASVGYIFEVDLDYPPELHNAHNDLPFCPEHFIPPNAKYSKLCLTLHSKTHYVIHYQNLKQALRNGLVLNKIYRVLKFYQSPWLKSYVDLNTEMRIAATNSFEKDFFKLMINSVFGKTMESVDKRLDVKLKTFWKNCHKTGAEALIARPNFKNCSIFTENFVAIQMHKSRIYYDKPIYVGFSVLDLSKTIIYNFFYDFLKKNYGNKVSLLYTDTDSLIIEVETKNFYSDMKQYSEYFDTSNYKIGNIHNIIPSTSVIGRMKDEYKGSIIREFYGTGAKAYCVVSENEITKKAKGVTSSVIQKELQVSDYNTCVSTPHIKIFKKMHTFHSVLHEIYTEYKNKVALSYFDDKRYLLKNSFKTLAWGHKDI